MYERAEIEKGRLLQAMEAFQATTKLTRTQANKGHKVEKDTTKEPQTWADVVQAMKDARARYEEKKNSGRMSAVNGFFESLGNNGEIFQAWLGLLPNGDYTSVICGAFRLVINATFKISEMRDLIFSSLGKIPAALETAKEYLQMNDLYQNKILHLAFARLCASILVAFEHMVRWLSERSIMRAMKSLLKQDDYEKQLKMKIQDVYDCAKNVRQQAERCSQELIGKVHQEVTKSR